MLCPEAGVSAESEPTIGNRCSDGLFDQHNRTKPLEGMRRFQRLGEVPLSVLFPNALRSKIYSNDCQRDADEQTGSRSERRDMMQELAPYALAPDVCQAVIDVARSSDVLIFGELHGTQEVPRLLLSLLSALIAAGYRGLALEILHHDRETLEGWARAQEAVLPEFFAHPWADGRGNREVLALIQQVLVL